MLKFVNQYGKDNPEKFNDDFIFSRVNDNLMTYVDDICLALEVINGVEYLGSELITDESKLKTRVKDDIKWIPLSDTRVQMIRVKFRLFTKTKEEIVEKEILYPKIIDNFFFILNGTRYFPMYQIVDSSTYHTERSLTLKTLLMPIVIENSKDKIVDVNGEIFPARNLTINLFKQKINFTLYFLSEMGWDATIEFMGLKDILFIYSMDEEVDDSWEEHFYRFDINSKVFALVNKDAIDHRSNYYRDAIYNIFKLINIRVDLKDVMNHKYWKKRLGAMFIKNASGQLRKSEQILVSFNRILDRNTKRVLRIQEGHKQNVYTIVRWMVANYDDLRSKNNMDLNYKRIRLHEYLLNPLLRRFSDDTYRILNSRTVNMTKLQELFTTLGPGFIVGRLLKSNVARSTATLMRQYNSVNEMHLFNAALKYSFRGPQSVSEGGEVRETYRGLHPSYIGRLSLTTSSSSDPGLTGTLTPFIKTDGYYFSDKYEIYDNEKLLPLDFDVTKHMTTKINKYTKDN